LDDDDLFTKIRQALEREDLEQALSGEKGAIPSDDQQPPLDVSSASSDRRVRNLFSEYAPGLVLIAWTILPLSLALLFVDSLSAFLCLYPLLCPFIWVALARWKPDKATSTVTLGIVGHILLSICLWFIWMNSGSTGTCIGCAVIFIFFILALLVFSTLGSIFTILITAFFRLGEKK
jgi:hypothetical protein